MRRSGDNRPDEIVKKEILDTLLNKDSVIRVYDDRPKVVRMWRAEGLEVVDCGDGVEF